MKKNIFLASSLFFAAVLASCTNEIENVASQGDFSVEASMCTESRTSLAENGTTVVWSEGDQIYLFGGSSNSTMTLVSGVGQTIATFQGGVNGFPSQLTHALYPVPTVSNGTYTYDFPSEITYSKNSNAPMFGSLDGGSIAFENLTPLVRVPLVGLDGSEENTLVLTMDGITGTATVDVETGALVFPQTGMGSTVTVTIPAGVTSCYVDIPVPAKTYQGYVITLNDNVIASKTFTGQEGSLAAENVALVTLGEIQGDEDSELTPETDGSYVISTAAEFIQFAQDVNGGEDFSGKTVKLGDDIDLAGFNWTPIGDCKSGNYFKGTFDGDNKVISNLYVDRSTDDYQCSTAGLFGWIDFGMATIQNVKVDRATVKGSHWTGVIAGYATGRIENCEVSNSIVEGYNVNDGANGDKIGGIVGFLNDHSYLNNNKVLETTISGNRDLGGVAGAVAASTIEMNNNAVEYVDLTYTEDESYASAGVFVSGRTGYQVNSTNTYINVNITRSTAVVDNDDLKKVIGFGVTEVTLAENTYIIPSTAKGKTLTVRGVDGTIVDATHSCGQSILGAAITFENVTIKGQTSGNYKGFTHVGFLLFKNCTFEGKITIFSNTVFEECTFNNKNDYAVWTSWGGNETKFVDCIFYSGGKALLLYGGSDGNKDKKLIVEGCKFYSDKSSADDKAAIETGDDYNATYEIVVTDTYVSDNFSITTQKKDQGGTSLGTILWGNKDLMPQNRLNVVVDGVDVY